MSHRVYLYNVNEPAQAKDSDTMMMEWGYELPLLLQPLLVQGGFISGNNYNNHTEPDNAGIYYDARAGIEHLKAFYSFLEKQDGLIGDHEAFAEAKHRLFDYLDRLEQPYFHLDAWDVFNMDEIPHAEQAEAWLAEIAHNNAMIQKAMEQNDLSLLRYADLMGVSPGFRSFAELLNYKGYDYGWGCIWLPFEEEADVDIFEENGLLGLKDKDGSILLQPQFDVFANFGPEGVAVVAKDGKFGYVNKSGVVTIPLEWEDASDFEYGCSSAIVKRAGRFGLINASGGLVADPRYDQLEAIDYSGYFAAEQDGKWGVLDSSGSVIVPITYDEPFENGFGYYHTAVKGQPGRHIFNEQFAYVGQFPVSALEPVGDGLLLVKPHTNVNCSSLYSKNGTLLASGFDKLNRQTDFPNMLILRKGKQYGLLGIKQETFLLPYGYDALIDLQAADREGGASNLVLARKDGKTGVFNGDPDHPSWLFPLDDYEAVCWLYDQVFALRRNGRWGIADSHDHWRSGFEFDYVERRMLEEASAYAIAGPDVYVVSPEGLTSADRLAVREEAEDEYYSRYFETDVLKLLLAYAYSDDPGGDAADENPMHELYNQAQDAYERGDFERAVLYDTIAAEKGYSPSMNNLGSTYYSTEGYTDGDKAFYWYEKGAEAGDIDAMNGLGVCYLDGVGTATDIDQALHWLGEAAERNNPYAHNNLADLYFDGLLVPHDLGKALGHYEQGEALETPNYIRLGYIHERRGDAEKAVSYYRLAYEDGCEVGAFNMGICCSQGIGITKNTDSAIRYFQAALERDYPAAHIELARIYKSGNDEADESLAEYHIREAEKAGLDIPEELLANP